MSSRGGTFLIILVLLSLFGLLSWSSTGKITIEFYEPGVYYHERTWWGFKDVKTKLEFRICNDEDDPEYRQPEWCYQDNENEWKPFFNLYDDSRNWQEEYYEIE